MNSTWQWRARWYKWGSVASPGWQIGASQVLPARYLIRTHTHCRWNWSIRGATLSVNGDLGKWLICSAARLWRTDRKAAPHHVLFALQFLPFCGLVLLSADLFFTVVGWRGGTSLPPSLPPGADRRGLKQRPPYIGAQHHVPVNVCRRALKLWGSAAPRLRVLLGDRCHQQLSQWIQYELLDMHGPLTTSSNKKRN